MKMALINFLVELTSPVGPEAFAGFGPPLQNRQAADTFAYFESLKNS